MEQQGIKDLSQMRADFAFEEVKGAKTTLNGKAGEFKSHIKKVPIMIRTSGLAATYAFVFSKRKDQNSYFFIEEISRKWLQKRRLLADSDAGNLAKSLSQMDRDQYRRVMRELLALFTWLKRFADGLIEKEEE